MDRFQAYIEIIGRATWTAKVKSSARATKTSVSYNRIIQKMSKNTRKTAQKRPLTTPKSTKKVVTPVNENIFASPWKKSDVILEVEDTEFHVHRTILTMHSPVFDAMFGGNFKEASEERVKLPGKTAEEMLQFLKLLYPESMIPTPQISFACDQKIVYSILRLADEYQTEELMRKCLAKIVIVSENVFKILPYASKYAHELREECVRHVAKYVTMSQVERAITTLDTSLMQELLVAKCRYLEKRVTKYRESQNKNSSSSSSEDSSSEESSD